MGFQITVMLTLVVYIEGLSNNLPIMQTIQNAPRLLHFFVLSIIVVALSILGNDFTFKNKSRDNKIM